MILDFTPIIARWQMLMDGAWLTVQLAAVTTLTGFLLGTICAIARRSDFRSAATISGIYVEAIRNTPFLVPIFLVYFRLVQPWSVTISGQGCHHCPEDQCWRPYRRNYAGRVQFDSSRPVRGR